MSCAVSHVVSCRTQSYGVLALTLWTVVASICICVAALTLPLHEETRQHTAHGMTSDEMSLDYNTIHQEDQLHREER